MTDYERGFALGETIAWHERHEPIPPLGQIHNEQDRGYWAARLPRSPDWHNCRPRVVWCSVVREAAT